jgi:hypothetical protein
MKILMLTITLLLSDYRPMFAYSTPGHQAIAKAAFKILEDTPTAEKLRSILDGEQETYAAVWLDKVRENALTTAAEKVEANTFQQAFKLNSEWHFTNFTVGSTEYSSESKFAKTDDVVHALKNAILVLEGASSPMTKRQALRTVIHLVGDIHQPLHCITGYYDLSDLAHPKLLTNVADPANTPEDRGGNQLYYTKSEELHALWDLGLPNMVSPNVDGLAVIIGSGGIGSEPATPGDYHAWPEQWASDSMTQANAAYQGISFDKAAYVPDPRKPGKTKLEISITLPNGTTDYEKNQKARAQAQLHKATIHLAQLLAAIEYQ